MQKYFYKNTSQNIREYPLIVSVYGTEVLEQSKLVDTSSQLCLDDIESKCYKSDTFFFPNDSVPDGSKIKLVERESLSGVQSCEDGINKIENTPWTQYYLCCKQMIEEWQNDA